MCLELTGKKIVRRGKYVYKGLNLADWTVKTKLVSPYYEKEWKPGVIISDRCKKLGRKYRTKLTDEEGYNQSVDHGIHVFHNAKDAKQCEDNDVVVRLVVDDKDLVSHGLYGAYINSVYERVTLTKEEYDRAIKAVQKLVKCERKDDIPF